MTDLAVLGTRSTQTGRHHSFKLLTIECKIESDMFMTEQNELFCYMI